MPDRCPADCRSRADTGIRAKNHSRSRTTGPPRFVVKSRYLARSYPLCHLAGAVIRERDRLAGQAGRLPVVRRVIQKPLASLPGDDVDHGALHVAELGGRADRLDLHFLNEVDARLGSRDAVARAGEVRAVEEKLVLVGAGAERGHGGGGAARRRRGRDSGGGPDQVEHARPSRRDRLEVLGAEAGPESGVSRFDARAGALDHDRFREAGQLQDSRSLDGGAGADADVLFVIASQIPAARCRARTVPEAEPGSAVAPSRSWSASPGRQSAPAS